LVVSLIWLRHYPTEDFLSWLTGVSSATISNILNLSIRLLHNVLKENIYIPSRKEREEEASLFAGGLVVTGIVDGTSQEIYSAKQSLLDHERFSTHRNMPCYNRLILVSPKGSIYWISNSYLGSVSDGMITNFEESKRIWKIFEKDEYIMGDAGFGALLKFHNSIIPIKAPQTKEGKEFNNEVAKLRIVVENVFCHIKAFKSTSEIWRHSEELNQQVWFIVAALSEKKLRN